MYRYNVVLFMLFKWRLCELGKLNRLVVQLALELLVVRHLAHGLHEVLLDDILTFRSASICKCYRYI